MQPLYSGRTYLRGKQSVPGRDHETYASARLLGLGRTQHGPWLIPAGDIVTLSHIQPLPKHKEPQDAVIALASYDHGLHARPLPAGANCLRRRTRPPTRPHRKLSVRPLPNFRGTPTITKQCAGRDQRTVACHRVSRFTACRYV